MQLPAELRIALEMELERVPGKGLAEAAAGLSKRYRDCHGRSDAPFLRSPLDAAAYVAYRLPATFAATGAVLREVANRRPDLQPRTLLDIGAGPGTVGWAAVDVWPDLEHIKSLERDRQMIQLGERLSAHATSMAIRNQERLRIDVTGHWESPPADITVAAYVLGELAASERTKFVRRMWECTDDTCVIIEPGTPRGFSFIRDGTEVLVDAGAHIVAPFPPDWQCLASQDDWCHFSERVPRTRMQRRTKDATLSYEDEKYSYVAASRVPGVPIGARVVRHPQIRAGHVRLTLCTSEGLKDVVVTKSNREAFRLVRNLTWGSAIPVEQTGPFR